MHSLYFWMHCLCQASLIQSKCQNQASSGPFRLSLWVQEHHPRRFKLHFGASDNGVQDFWYGLKSSPSGSLLWEQHPWLRGRTPEDLDHHLPVCLFDDAGPVSNSQSSYVRQLYSILGKGADRETHILLSTGLTNTQLPDQSWPVIMQSFENLARPKAAGRWGAVVFF